MSTATETRTTYTPEDLLGMPGGEFYELVDGNIVELKMSALTSIAAARLVRYLQHFCEIGELAWVMDSECGYRCFPDRPNKVRRPDVSCVLQTRLPVSRLSEGFVGIAPDLVVEVISPNDLAYEVDEKIDEYLAAGVPLIWVINPERRSARVYRADGTVNGVREGDELSGEGVLPGFRCRLGDIFPPAPAPAT